VDLPAGPHEKIFEKPLVHINLGRKDDTAGSLIDLDLPNRSIPGPILSMGTPAREGARELEAGRKAGRREVPPGGQ